MCSSSKRTITSIQNAHLFDWLESIEEVRRKEVFEQIGWDQEEEGFTETQITQMYVQLTKFPNVMLENCKHFQNSLCGLVSRRVSTSEEEEMDVESETGSDSASEEHSNEGNECISANLPDDLREGELVPNNISTETSTDALEPDKNEKDTDSDPLGDNGCRGNESVVKPPDNLLITDNMLTENKISEGKSNEISQCSECEELTSNVEKPPESEHCIDENDVATVNMQIDKKGTQEDEQVCNETIGGVPDKCEQLQNEPHTLNKIQVNSVHENFISKQRSKGEESVGKISPVLNKVLVSSCHKSNEEESVGMVSPVLNKVQVSSCVQSNISKQRSEVKESLGIKTNNSSSTGIRVIKSIHKETKETGNISNTHTQDNKNQTSLLQIKMIKEQIEKKLSMKNIHFTSNSTKCSVLGDEKDNDNGSHKEDRNQKPLISVRKNLFEHAPKRITDIEVGNNSQNTQNNSAVESSGPEESREKQPLLEGSKGLFHNKDGRDINMNRSSDNYTTCILNEQGSKNEKTEQQPNRKVELKLTQKSQKSTAGKKSFSESVKEFTSELKLLEENIKLSRKRISKEEGKHKVSKRKRLSEESNSRIEDTSLANSNVPVQQYANQSDIANHKKMQTNSDLTLRSLLDSSSNGSCSSQTLRTPSVIMKNSGFANGNQKETGNTDSLNPLLKVQQKSNQSKSLNKTINDLILRRQSSESELAPGSNLAKGSPQTSTNDFTTGVTDGLFVASGIFPKDIGNCVSQVSSKSLVNNNNMNVPRGNRIETRQPIIPGIDRIYASEPTAKSSVITQNQSLLVTPNQQTIASNQPTIAPNQPTVIFNQPRGTSSQSTVTSNQPTVACNQPRVSSSSNQGTVKSNQPVTGRPPLSSEVNILIDKAVQLYLFYFCKQANENLNCIPSPILGSLSQYGIYLQGERFKTVNSYLKLYFCCYIKLFKDEMVSKHISKIAELLHLSIADFHRREERKKRAAKLTSQLLRKEEINRADGEFSEMLVQRGGQFADFFLPILTQITQVKYCEYPMLLTLYFRVTQSLIKIDNGNAMYVFTLRELMNKLTKNSRRPVPQICSLLFDMENEQFKQTFLFVKQCLTTLFISGYREPESNYILELALLKPISNPLSEMMQNFYNKQSGLSSSGSTQATMSVGNTTTTNVGQRPSPFHRAVPEQQSNLQISSKYNLVQPAERRFAPQHPVHHINRTQNTGVQTVSRQQNNQAINNTQKQSFRGERPEVVVRSQLPSFASFSHPQTRNLPVMPDAQLQQSLHNRRSDYVQQRPVSSRSDPRLNRPNVGTIQEYYERPPPPYPNNGVTQGRAGPEDQLWQPSGVVDETVQSAMTQGITRQNIVTNETVFPDSTTSPDAMSTNMTSTVCASQDCSKLALLACSLCRNAFYCTTECQTKDWYQLHSEVCLELK